MTHATWAFGVGMPIIILWVIGIPVIGMLTPLRTLPFLLTTFSFALFLWCV